MLAECRYSERVSEIARFYTEPMALKIKELRVARGWTQADLAEKAKMSRSQLAQIEAETRPANTLRLNAIASALKVRPEELFSTLDDTQMLLDAFRLLDESEREMVLRMAEALAERRKAG